MKKEKWFEYNLMNVIETIIDKWTYYLMVQYWNYNYKFLISKN